MCYNIWNFNGDWGSRSELIAEAMRQPPLYTGEGTDQVPDIVAVQEVRHDNGGPGNVGPDRSRHQVDHLLWRMESFGLYQVIWVPAMSYVQVDRGGLSYQTEGPTLMSRLPILRTDALQLTRHWPADNGDEHQRLCLGATVLTEALGPVNVLTSHLSLSDSARLVNVYEICRWAKREWSSAGGAITFLMGDLNMVPSDPAMQFLLGNEEFRGETCDFRDVWDIAGQRVHELGGEFEEKGITFNNLDDKPNKRIDFILVRGPVPDGSFPLFEVVGSKAKSRKSKVAPSDHLGLRVHVDPPAAEVS